MATGLGFPAIPTPNNLDLRALQTAIGNARQRIEQLEAQLKTTQSAALQTSQSSTLNLNALLKQLSNLLLRVAALENAAATDIGEFIAGEAITLGQGVVPYGPTTVVAADPSDPTRMFGLIGIALNSATAGTAVSVQRRGVLAPAGVSGLETGRAVYIDAVGLTQAPDSDATALPVGVAVSPTQLFVFPDWPALLDPGITSAVVDSYLDYMPVTYRVLQTLSGLESMISALPYSSGAEGSMMVPVVYGGVAYQVSAADIAALGGSGGGGTYPKGAAWSGSGVAVVASVADVVYGEAQASGTIVSATVLGAGGTGSCTIEVWKSTYAGALPTVANKISASAPATITSSTKSQDTTLTGWSKTVAAGDIFAFKLTACSTFTWISVILEIQP